ncbi:helix-turn-helix domain-containing protein [Pseudomonas sp. ZM23]|uniref:Helix-turn-helix domain-containing protein n=1 Tax=Pseudomonas triclosanedens TaxID=2961893 RepID=A0ABY6ZS80_9PSED|nr:helix-turn-helix domain-containing protein [Pseudomonas triclosanedens]MCP8467050.1 helix-turn-helix domain-containing protein [Pseudomonas triclosanedens]MCP8472802.1 helix-turn-helix domain-containing protein [Pseudomonas triclosanedens]MCP8478233.1 helix-turn-helix domain-containing protein [Pseudomonas triclosanedens]WAI47639.1 helix-turn-helix domain-containing protein [Pseudomonas triclosanedens]
MKEMDIGQVARWSGLPVSTLRFYEEKGLIRSIGRNGMRRVFSDEVLSRLSLIALGREAGFSLEDIAAIFVGNATPTIDRARLREKADELDRSIRRLGAIRDGLRHAADCPAPDHLACPKFRRLMDLAIRTASRGRARAPRRVVRQSRGADAGSEAPAT